MTSVGPGDASKLAVLGLLKMGPNHGYGLRAILESWEVHRWLDIKYGSIYAALKRFEESGLVEVVGVEADRGPTRTTYGLTEAGSAHLEELARRAWAAPPRWSLPIDLLVMFLSFDWMGLAVLDRSEIIDLLDERTSTLERAISDLTQTAQRMIGVSELKALQALQHAHFDHGIQLLNAELTWTRELREAIHAGDFDLPQSP